MGRTFSFGNDGNPNTIDLEISFVGGVGFTTRNDEFGNPQGGSFNQASITFLNYLQSSAFNIATLVGVDSTDTMVATEFGDLIEWERTLFGSPRYLLPTGIAAIDVFDMGAGDDVVNLTWRDDNNPATIDRQYLDDATILGGLGNDIIWSGNGNDQIFGGGGVTVGGGGSETLFGGGGNDQIFGSALTFNNISGDSGNDTLFGGGNNDGIQGGSDNDTAYGGNGNDAIDGDSGDDTLYGGNGQDNVVGDTGNDIIRGDAGDDFIDGGAGFFDTLYGGLDADTVFDSDGAKYASGDAGNDNVNITYAANWSAGLSTVRGGDGADSILVNGLNGITVSVIVEGDDTVGGAGADTVVARGSYASIVANLGGGNDSYTYQAFGSPSGARVDTVYGGTGNDTIDTGAGNDFLFGDDNNDTLIGGAGADSLYGGAGIDIISYATSTAGVVMGLNGVVGSGGDAQGDVAWTDVENLTGSELADGLTGNASANVILGLGGNDTIEGLGGADSLNGGTGINWLSYANSAGAVTVNLGAGSGSGGDAAGDTFTSFQNLIGSGLADSLIGSATANTIYGGAGVDTIEGGGGADSMHGDGGADWLSYAGSAAGVSVNMATGTGSGGDATGDTFTSFRNLIGSANGDNLIGDATPNTILGGNGVDTIEGGVGGDSLDGEGGEDWLSYAGSTAGVIVDIGANTASGGDAEGDTIASFRHLIGSGQADTLYGGGAANSIVAGEGNDYVEGGNGGDAMFGGGGTDTLSYVSSTSEPDGRTGVVVTLGSGIGTGGHAAGDTNSGFENLIGSAFDDVLGGDAASNVIEGGAGGDRISAGGRGDTLYGGAGNDELAGEDGLDTLFGGVGDDRLYVDSSGTVGAGGIVVAGWDGETGSSPVNVSVAAGAALFGDTAFGGADIDTLDISDASNRTTRTAYFSPTANIAQVLAGVEIVVAGAAADVINLTYNDGSTRVAYAENVTIFAGANADVVFSGSGNDLVVGGREFGVGGAELGDTLYGGQGNDRLVGDDFNAGSIAGGADLLYGGQGDDTVEGGVGNDTLFGGSGLDTLDGGDGNDVIVDGDGVLLASGGYGSDIIALTLDTVGLGGPDDGDGAGPGGGPVVVYGGINSTLEGLDGADRVFVAGNYDEVVAGLGFDNDIYVGSADAGSGLLRDLVSGDSGNDLISTWYGNDEISGGADDDALWGGAGSDTIYGGPGTDYLYGGFGDNDVLVGGAGTDYYYWSRTDGLGDQLYDDFRGADPLPGQQADNVLVVFPDFDPTEVNGDGLRTGSGVVEVDRDLHDLAGGDDMVQLTDIDGAGGSMYRLTVLTGDGAGNYVEFDQRDVQTILLWNNDAAGGGQVIQTYAWDAVDGRYEYVG